jgi:hypothetical protein
MVQCKKYIVDKAVTICFEMIYTISNEYRTAIFLHKQQKGGHDDGGQSDYKTGA